MINHLRTTLSALLALAFAFAAAPAWALGLGQIKVLSQRDQPLLAEIPVISADPSELEALQARLASPDTFARIGLAPPQGIVSDLQFAVALDARGRPVVRVTSAAPVQQPLLTFLLEVDWGQGRLVREYSALLDTPQTAAAPAQPPIQEATVDPVDVVVRPPAAEPENPLAAAAPRPVPLPAPKPTPPAPTPADVLQARAPVPVPLPAPSESEVAAAAPIEVVAEEQTRTVRRGETLAGIAAEVGRGHNLDQTLVALLRANPEAFIGGNANRLRAGAVLRIPAGSGIDRYSPEEAAVVVREQATQSRGTGRALPQPPAVVGAAPADPVATPAAPAKPRTPRTAAQARLEIVPAAGNEAKRAGQRSGTSAGGEGDMVRQELQQTKENLAARDAEVQELKARVAELEQLQQKQSQLLAMKDNALASAQQKLAAGQQAAAATPKAENGSLLPWIGTAVGLVLLALVAVLWLRRRAAEPAVVTALRNDVARDRKSPVADDFADAFNTDPADTAEDAAPAFVDEPQADAPSTPIDVPAEAPATAPSPAWSRLVPSAEPESPKPAAPARPVPTWHAGGVEVSPLNPAPPGQGRLDLAKAYLEMGDRDTARSLLQEVAARGDTLGVRMEAEKLLRDLG